MLKTEYEGILGQAVFLIRQSAKREVCLGGRQVKDKGCLSGIIVAGTRIWDFGENVLANVEICLPGSHASYHSGAPGFHPLGQESLVLLRSVMTIHREVGSEMVLETLTGIIFSKEIGKTPKQK